MQDPQREQAADSDFVGVEMDVVPFYAGAEERSTLFLHVEHEVVDGKGFGGESARDGECACYVAGVAFELAACVEEEEVFSRSRVIILHVVESCAVSASGHDGMVGLVFGAALDAGFQEEGFELGFVGCGGDGAHDGCVGCRGDGVCFADESDFVGGFDYAGVLDCRLEEVEVLVGEGEEGDMIGDLGGDGVDGGLGGCGCGCEMGVYVGGGLDFVDVVSG